MNRGMLTYWYVVDRSGGSIANLGKIGDGGGLGGGAMGSGAVAGPGGACAAGAGTHQGQFTT